MGRGVKTADEGDKGDVAFHGQAQLLQKVWGGCDLRMQDGVGEVGMPWRVWAPCSVTHTTMEKLLLGGLNLCDASMCRHVDVWNVKYTHGSKP